MIHTTAQNRMIKFDTTRDDHVQKSCYGLFLVSRTLWMDTDRMLSEYNVSTTDDVMYKIQYRSLIVEYASTGRRMNFEASESTTVQEVVDLALLDYADHRSFTFMDDGDPDYGLYTKGGERLKHDDRIWTCLKDLSPLVRP
jgi:hypothetical protein